MFAGLGQQLPVVMAKEVGSYQAVKIHLGGGILGGGERILLSGEMVTIFLVWRVMSFYLSLCNGTVR